MSFRSENEQYAVRGYRPVTPQEAREWQTLQPVGILDTANGEVVHAWLMRHLGGPDFCKILIRGSRALLQFSVLDGQPVRAHIDDRWMIVMTANPWPADELTEEIQEDTSLFDALQASVEINKLRDHVHRLPSQDDHKDVLSRLRDLETLVLSLSERVVEIESGTAPISFRVASPV